MVAGVLGLVAATVCPDKQSKADPVAVAAAIESAEGTRNHYRAATVRATVSGLTGTIDVIVFTGDASWGLRLPDSVIAVYQGAQLLPFALGGLLIAALGALLSAAWAAGSRTVTALRIE
ncbi:hypothetical protein [Streptomyces poriferorum]|uniref:Uncharacterized protein n=1 Tax=Streptomyces poriferorum TaxID=2798799 RepID=A0ABY9J070_9ACTN|nr:MULTISPECIES: hypothetical protein [unclassified Streptomyces]MDP5309607.1 hypothetical protein [Streptomyces sp. Alt4]WLQ61205.1 hypothetical protein P8A19_39825 [Streptomyces sp. Alt2]